MRKLLLLFSLVLGANFQLSAQSQRVSGTVTGPEGSPMAGVTVVLAGTGTATMTGTDGQYSISAPANGSLEFSFLGMASQTVEIGNRTVINVTLTSDAQLIEDVVVTGLGGIISKEAYTGSAVQLNADLLAKRQTTNVVNALVGSVAGVQMRGASGQPGSSSQTLSVRGTTQSGNMGASSSPLVLVDGSPYPTSLSNIPQSDIESVTVLKDAASAALYGARGASGVILVTTKKGSKSRSLITADFKIGVNSRALQRYDVITDPGEYYEAYYAQVYNWNRNVNGLDAVAAETASNTRLLSDLRYNVFTVPSGENLIVGGKLNPNATHGRKVTYNGVDYWMQADNWYDEAYKTGIRSESNVSVSGGSDRSTYYMSVAYLDEEGIVDASKFTRISARLKADYQAKKWLKVGANFGYVNSLSSQNSYQSETSGYANNLFSVAGNMGAIFPIYIRTVDANGNVSIKTDQYGNNAYDYGTGYGVTRPFMSTSNPIGENKYNKYSIRNNQLAANGFADFIITDHLTLNINSSVTWGNSFYSTFGNMYYGTSAQTGGNIKKDARLSLRTNNQQLLVYSNTFGVAHHLRAMVGHEYYDQRAWNLSAEARGMFSPDILEINAAATKGAAVATSDSNRYNNEGFFFNGTYDYDNKYFAGASFRRDASSRFHPDHRWGNFWSVSGAWVLSRENFMSDVTWIDMLKLKASIGQQGNDNIGDFVYGDRYTLSPSSDTGMAASLLQRGNPLITWETNTNTNIGLEFSLWNGRLSGDINYYHKKTSDVLFQVSVPESAGFRAIYQNSGDNLNQGIELSLSGDIIRTDKLVWSMYVNASHNKSRILSLPAAKINPVFGGYVEGSQWYKVGGPIYNIYRKVFAGLDENGVAQYYADSDGQVNYGVDRSQKTTNWGNADYYELGDMAPDIFGGFGTSVQVAGFDASITFDFQIGGTLYDGYYASSLGAFTAPYGSVIHKDWKNSWTPENKGSNMPRWQYMDQYTASASDRFLTNASYLNFQSFTVGYTLPEKWLTNVGTIRVYAMGENLWFKSARKGLDPRYAFGGPSNNLAYSPIRTISGGVQLTF